MKKWHSCAILLLAVAATTLLVACGSDGRIRVYVEPSYEQPQLERLLNQHPDFFLLLEPQTADVRVSVRALPDNQERPGERHALILARDVRSGREVFAVARLIPRRGDTLPWVNNYEQGVHEGTLSDILAEVVHAVRAGRAPEGDTWAEYVSRNPNLNLP